MRHLKIISSFWHDLETERHAIQRRFLNRWRYGDRKTLKERGRRIIGFSDGEFRILSQADSGQFWLQFFSAIVTR